MERRSYTKEEKAEHVKSWNNPLCQYSCRLRRAQIYEIQHELQKLNFEESSAA